MRRLLLKNEEDSLDELPKLNPDIQLSQQEPQLRATIINNENQAKQFIQKKHNDFRAMMMQKFSDDSEGEAQNNSSRTLSVKIKKEEEKGSLNHIPKVEQREEDVNSAAKVVNNQSKKQIAQKDVQPKQKEHSTQSSSNIFKKPKMEFSKSFQPFIIEKKLTHGQKQVQIGKLSVLFPYQPYDVQISYMDKVFETLDSKSNALLESPTGTGKTLCLLSSVLTWIENNYQKTNIKTKVIYMSRTHSQLKQVHKQLQKTCFRPNMAVFASRDQLCIKESLDKLKGKEKIEQCGRGIKLAKKLKKQLLRHPMQEIDKSLVQSACSYYKEKQYVEWIAKSKLSNKLIDIPIMREMGMQEGFCPYFYPHNVKNITTLFLMPYNYLLDAYLLPTYQDMIADSIIIFDQAHNVAEAACEGRSLTLDSSNIEGAIAEINGMFFSPKASESMVIIRDSFDKEKDFLLRNLEDFMANFAEFGKKHLPEVEQDIFKKSQREQASSKLFSKSKTDEFIFEMFCGKIIPDANLPQFSRKEEYYQGQMKSRLLNPLNQIVEQGQLLIEAIKETNDGYYHNFQKFIVFAAKINSLLMPFIYKKKEDNWIDIELNHYRLHVSKTQGANTFTFGVKCLVPWLTFQGIQRSNPRSIILTSGTLRPLDMWQKQLQLKFAQKMVNSHVIKKDQIRSKIVLAGPSETPFNLTFDSLSRNRDKIFKDLIHTIIQICSKVPNGVLLVFPSFRLQNDFQYELARSAKRYKLEEYKHVMFEQKNSINDIQIFKKRAIGPKGALMGMICRGRLSQGIDFPDELCRAVIMVGIPYASIKDPFIVEKKAHLDAIASQSVNKVNVLRGQEWYFMGTIRTINQALGRVIRHAKDYGMIFFIDKRYEEPKFKKHLPGWIVQSTAPVDGPHPLLLNQISRFYRNMEEQFPSTQQTKKILFEDKKQDEAINSGPKANAFQMLMKGHKNLKKQQSRKRNFDFI